jgi:ADP-heptose:LPS heptosyltransferase
MHQFKGKHFWIDLRGNGGLGNFLLFLPVITNISKIPDVTANLWISDNHIQLSHFLPKNVRSTKVPIRSLSMIKSIFKLGKVDYAITAGCAKSFLLICLIKKIAIRAGFDGSFTPRYVPKWFQLFLTHRAHFPKKVHEIKLNMQILKILDIPITYSLPRIIPDSSYLAKAEIFLLQNEVHRKKTIFGIQPGSSSRQAWKRWPIEHYRQLVRWCDSQEFTVFIFGSEEERDLCKNLSVGRRTILVIGEDIGLVTALLYRCKALISHDSFFIHLACALGIPNLALYGPSDVVWSGSWGKKSHQIHIRRDCRYCYGRNPLMPSRCKVNCMEDISSEEVIAKLKNEIL